MERRNLDSVLASPEPRKVRGAEGARAVHAPELNGIPDDTGAYVVNVTTGGYGIEVVPDFDVTLEFVAALLNSELLSWALKRYRCLAGRLLRCAQTEPVAATDCDTSNREAGSACRGLPLVRYDRNAGRRRRIGP